MIFKYFNDVHRMSQLPTNIQMDNLYYLQQRKGIYKLFAFFELLDKSTYKAKFLLQTMNQMRLPLNALMTTGVLMCLGKITYDNKQYIYNLLDKKEQTQEYTEPLDPIAIRIVINEVLRKESINAQLGRVISQVCEKPSVSHNLSKQINKIFDNSSIQRKTKELTVKVLREQVLYKSEIDKKLQQVVINLIRQNRDKVTQIVANVIPTQQENTNQAMRNLMAGMGPNMAESMNKQIQETLDDPKTVIQLLKLIQSMI